MKIGGYQKSSHTDFPGKVASVVFTQGCGWRCPYCHNRALVYPSRFQPTVPEEQIFEHLELQQDELDGVVVTGGEPTQQAGLIDFFRRVRAMGFATKLETNGSHPEVLSQLISESLLDYIAMDIKGPLNEYKRFVGCEVDTGMIEVSIDLIKQSGVTYEFRTTLVGGLHKCDHIEQLAPLLHGVRRYAVQSYRMPPCDYRSATPFTPPETELFATASKALRSQVGEFFVR